MNRMADNLCLRERCDPATPSNIAEKLADSGTLVRRVSGLNLPMLLRVLNYSEQNLAELAQTAAHGARAGVRIDDA